MKNLAHSASFESLDKSAPSKPGTKHLVPFSREDAEKVWRFAEANGFPASHHSSIFQQAYGPAYRVIAKDFWP
jgi:hypothetical protein